MGMTFSTLWNTRPRDEAGRFLPARREATVNGYELQKGTAYQFDLWDGGQIATCVWTGTVDSDGCAVMRSVDSPWFTYCPRSATWFMPLAEVTA